MNLAHKLLGLVPKLAATAYLHNASIYGTHFVRDGRLQDDEGVLSYWLHRG